MCGVWPRVPWRVCGQGCDNLLWHPHVEWIFTGGRSIWIILFFRNVCRKWKTDNSFVQPKVSTVGFGATDVVAVVAAVALAYPALSWMWNLSQVFSLLFLKGLLDVCIDEYRNDARNIQKRKIKQSNSSECLHATREESGDARWLRRMAKAKNYSRTYL